MNVSLPQTIRRRAWTTLRLAVVAAAGIAVVACVPPSAGQSDSPPSIPARQASAGSASTGWEITVYVTAVEQYYSGATQDVVGCLSIDCSRANDDSDLGIYPASFLNRVKDEGTGRITSGPNAGKYLNWSAGISATGYWLDTAPRDSYGEPLVPFVSAASDGVPRGTEVRIVDCGTNDDGTAVNGTICDRFTQADWQIRDQFTPGLGGAKHIDLYLGEETQQNFEQTSPYWITFENATVLY